MLGLDKILNSNKEEPAGPPRNIRGQFKQKWFLRVLCAIFLIEAFILIQIFFVIPNTGFFATVLPGILVDLANISRQGNDLPVLQVDPLLEEAARLKAQDMAQRGYFSHNTPDGKTPWYWLGLVGYSFSAAGENLAVNFFDSQDINTAWMQSPTHRENILNSGFTEIGVATAKGIYQGQDTVFVVQFFGKPKQETLAVNSAATQAVPSVPPAVQSSEPPQTEPSPPASEPPASSVPPETSVEQTPNSVGETQSASPAETETKAGATLNDAKELTGSNAGLEEIFLKTENGKGESKFAIITSGPEVVSLGESLSTSPTPPKGFLGTILSWKKSFVSPRTIANAIYLLIGALIFVNLLLRAIIRFEAKHSDLVINGIFILMVIASLVYFNYHLFLSQAKIF